MSFSRILIALDGSMVSFDAARTGLDLAAALSAKVEIIYIVEPPVPFSGEIGIPADAVLNVATCDDEAIVENLRRAVRVPEGTTHLARVGHPADTISRALLGSVAESVVRHASCPVLVVRKSDQQAK